MREATFHLGPLLARGEKGENFPESLPDLLQIGRSSIGERQRSLFLVSFVVCSQMLPCARYGESFFVEKFFYAQHIFNVLVAIHALSGAAFDRFELRKLSFPETQNVCWQTAKLGNFSDPEIQLVRDYHVGSLDRFGRSFVASTHRDSRSGCIADCASLPIAFLARPEVRNNPSFRASASFLTSHDWEIKLKNPRRGASLERLFETFCFVRSIVSRTVSVSFSWQPFSLLA